LTQATVTRPSNAVGERVVPRSRFKPSGRARGRLAAGVLVAVVGVLVNVAVYRGVSNKRAVLELQRDVPAGQQVSAEDWRTVKIGGDGAFRAVPASEASAVVGLFAKVRLVAGSLLVREALQSTSLVAPGAVVVAVTVPSGELPVGVRERSHVRVVVTAVDRSQLAIDGIVVGLPVPAGGTAGQVSVSIEVAAADANPIAAGDKVRIVLLEPGASG